MQPKPSRPLNLRIATPDDAEAIRTIYAPYVLGSAVSFEWELPSAAEIRNRVASTLQQYPWMVAENERGMVGYAYASQYRVRTAYQWSVEVTVYVQDGSQRTGVAHQLYTALFGLLKRQALVTAYAVVSLPNDSSVAFHERFGFEKIAVFPKAGFKLGQWHDVGWWRFEIDQIPQPSGEPTKFSKINYTSVT